MSAPGYRLVPLSCPGCGAPLRAEPDDVVYYCTACRNGYLLERASGELRRVPVAFLASPGKPVTRHLPFWLLPAKVQILQRSTTGISGGGLLRAFGLGGPEGPAVSDVAFAIPAFPTSISAAVALAQRYTERPPGAGELIGELLTGGVLRVEDAQKLAHYMLISAEAGKPDTLTELRYRIDFGEARLLGVPFTGQPGRLLDAFFGLAAEIA